LVAIVVLGFILAGTLLAGGFVGGLSDDLVPGWVVGVSARDDAATLVRKLGHLLGFAGLGVFAAAQRQRRVAWALRLAVLAPATEVLQSLRLDRTGSFLDILIDLSGLLLGFAFARGLARLRRARIPDPG
jgi:VanZ family protein